MIASRDGPAVQSWVIFSDRPISEIRSEAVQWRAELRIVAGYSWRAPISIDVSRILNQCLTWNRRSLFSFSVQYGSVILHS
jgi:hypothetical protein